jgi:cbb3-type cytochrome oxidase maturation protein
MVLPIWMLLVVFSLGISVGAFYWALRNGQFSDQDRARYLPLADRLPAPPVKNPSKLSLEVYVLMFIGLMVLFGLAASILLNFYR